MTMKKWLIGIGVLVTSGCDTTYQPMAWDGGYQDQQIAQGQYRLLYQGNSTTNNDWVLQNWHRRAAQLCPTGYQVLKIQKPDADSGTTTKEILSNPLTRRNPIVLGELKCTL